MKPGWPAAQFKHPDINLARREQMDLIALGTHGLGKGMPALVSVADQILSEAPCPVLTVGEPIRAHKAERIQRILYATDFLQHRCVLFPTRCRWREDGLASGACVR